MPGTKTLKTKQNLPPTLFSIDFIIEYFIIILIVLIILIVKLKYSLPLRKNAVILKAPAGYYSAYCMCTVGNNALTGWKETRNTQIYYTVLDCNVTVFFSVLTTFILIF